jgi:hypothetical protein
MRKWEYKIITNVLLETDALNDLGEQGWELLFVHCNCYHFKREIIGKTKK